jgi:lysozyme
MSDATGIDVSEPGTDWAAWKKNGITFAAIKATGETSYVSPAFAGDWEAARGSGLARIAYHYADPSRDPAAQALLLVATVDKAGRRPGDGFALDFETLGGLSPVDASFWAYVFCAEVARLTQDKHYVFVYCSPSFADTGACALLGSRPLWVAHWGVPAPDVPLPWKEWVIWQYAGGGYADHNRYNGDTAALHREL